MKKFFDLGTQEGRKSFVFSCLMALGCVISFVCHIFTIFVCTFAVAAAVVALVIFFLYLLTWMETGKWDII